MKTLKNFIFFLSASLLLPTFAQNQEDANTSPEVYVYREIKDTTEGRIRFTVLIHTDLFFSELEESLENIKVDLVKVNDSLPVTMSNDFYNSASIPLQLSMSLEGISSEDIYCILSIDRVLNENSSFPYFTLTVKDCLDESKSLVFAEEIFSKSIFQTPNFPKTGVRVEKEFCKDKVLLANSRNCSGWTNLSQHRIVL